MRVKEEELYFGQNNKEIVLEFEKVKEKVDEQK